MSNLFAPSDPFDPSVNESLLSTSIDPQSSVLSSIMGGAVATAVDIGASVWNSLPGTDEVETEDILSRIGGNALNVYQENPDTIKTLSLIGGAVLPGGAAIKGMNALRNGSKVAQWAPRWFTAEGKRTDIAKAAELVANGAKNTSEYKNLLWNMRTSTVANNLVDAAVAEVAVLGAFNAHPYMEDYFEDPAKNFAISMALGGGLGVAGGLIGDTFALKKATAAVEESAFETILGAVRPVQPAMPEATKVQTLDVTIKNLDNIIKNRSELGKTEVNDLVYQYAAKAKRDYELQQMEIFDQMLSPGLRELPIAEKDKLLTQVKNNSGFWGVTNIRPLSAKELVEGQFKGAQFLDEPVLKTKNAAGNDQGASAVWFPEIGKFGTMKDVQHHAGVSALNVNEKDLLNRVPDKVGLVPNFDYSLEVMAKSTPAVEADYAAWTLKFANMDDEGVEKYLKSALISSSDVPQLQALASRISASNKLRNTASVRIADRTAQADAILAGVDAERTLGGIPVRYKEALERTLNNQSVRQYLPSNAAARDSLRKWISGDTWELQKGATAYFAKGYAARSLATSGDEASVAAAKKFEAIYTSPESIALRQQLMSLADKEGKILLYRGINAPKVMGQSPLESMAVTLEKTSQFAKGSNGRSLLYKVDVDDVVAAFVDVGPAGDNVEVIVRSTAREAEAVISASGNVQFRESLKEQYKSSKVAMQARLGDLNEFLYEEKFKLVTNLLQKGYPIESIAKRTNIPVDSIQQFMATDLSMDAFTALPNISAFRTAEDVQKALSATNRPLRVRGNMKKAEYTKAHANLNAAALTNIDTMVKSTVLFNSNSEAVRSIGAVIYQEGKHALDIARDQLHKITNEAAGNRFLTSADQFARKLGDLGPIFSYVGKALEKVSNRTTEAVVKPIGDLMVPLSKDIAALTEFSVAHNLNAGLEGWRVYKDRKFWQKVQEMGEDGKMVTVLKPVKFNGQGFVVKNDHVDRLWTEMQTRSGELYELANARNKIMGTADVNNIGLWVPSFNPVNKFIAYVHDKAADTTRVLWGKTQQELEDAIKTFGAQLQQNPNLMIVRKSDQQWWSKLNGRLDPIQMKQADIAQKRTGSGASAIPKISTDVLAEVAGGYEHYINAQVRNLADVSMSDITDVLRQLSSINKMGAAKQPLGFVKNIRSQPKDAAASMRNLLLGHPSLGEYEGWQTLNGIVETGISMAASAFGAVWKTVSQPVSRRFGGAKELTAEQMKKLDYEDFVRQLERQGIVNPFEIYDQATALEKFGISRLADAPDVSKRIVNASNALAATVALRFAELAHPLVNLISMPIMMALANTSKMPPTFMGVAKGTANVPLTQVIFEGARAMNSPRFDSLRQKWKDLGYFTPMVSEASAVLRSSRSFEKGAIAKIENALDSQVVNWASKPADASEALSREYMMHAGAVLAKRLYPELGDDGITIFARDFMDKALGNYSASQRPVFFQGTAGVAMGLFQTYMLTLAQGIYRNIELKDWKALAKAAMAQSTIFGTSSMPGFDQVSKLIAEHYSDDNFDLTTGTYRALGDPMAEWILYGMPSNISGAAFYTRGDIDPRFPNILAGVDNIVGANFAAQTFGMLKNFAKSVAAADENVSQAMLQALSVQTMSRPIARLSELASGYSVTTQGNTVQIPEEVRTVNGIIARVLGTRPVEEAKLREAMHLNAYYGSIDYENRQSAINELRTAIRNGTVTEEKIAEVAEKYMRYGGTPRGWQSAFNTALAKTPMAGEDTFLAKIQDDSPFHFMIRNLE